MGLFDAAVRAMREPLTAERAAEQARHAAAAIASHRGEEIEVEEVVQNNDAYRVSLSHALSGDSSL